MHLDLPLGNFARARRATEKGTGARRAAVTQADKEIREVYKSELAKKSPADCDALAKTLLTQSLTSNESAPRFVLLHYAQDLAADAGDATTAFRAADSMASFYEIDVLPMKLKALTTASRNLSGRPAATLFVGQAKLLVDEAISRDDYMTAENAAGLAGSAAQKASDKSLIASVHEQAAELGAIRGEYKKVEPSVARLKSNPNDADANLTVGEFFGLYKGDWDKALPRLALSSDAKLKALALADLAAPANATSRRKIGDGWWSDAGPRTGPAKAHEQSRAAFWYLQCLAELDGFEKAVVEKRIAEARPSATRVVNLLTLVDKPAQGFNGSWRRNEGGLSCGNDGGYLVIPYSPPAEYDLTVSINRIAGSDTVLLIFPLENGAMYFFLGGWGNTVIGFGRSDDSGIYGVQKLEGNNLIVKGKTYKTLIKVRKGKVEGYVNDKLVATVNTDGTGLGVSSRYTVGGERVMGLEANRGCPTVFHMAEVNEVSGSGHVVQLPP